MSSKNIVIIGGGLIGLEMSEALAAHGVQVTIVERQPRILPNLLDEDTASFLCRHLESKGVAVHVDESVERMHGDMGAVTRVTTTRREIEADMVLVSLGVRPRSDLAREMGLALGDHGGILVNERMQTSDPDVYAGGDCVLSKNLLTGDWTYVPLGSVANKHGRVIGSNRVGGDETFPGVVGTGVVKVFDYNLGCTGLSEREARQRGHTVMTTLCPGPDRAHNYPGAASLLVKLIVTFCKVSLRGYEALRILQGAGFDNVRFMDGGVVAWPFEYAG